MKKIIYLLLIATLYGQQTTDENIQNISIVSTSNVFSEFYDCGCPKNPLGGIARKTFFLNNMMSGRESILIDAGNLFFDSNKINPDNLSLNDKKFKAENLVKTLEFTGQNIVNIGANDFKGGVEFLKEITNESSVNFISANLFNSSNELLFKPYHIILKENTRIAFIGLSQSANSRGLINKNFIEVGNKYIEELKDKADIIIMLVNVREDNVLDLSNSFSDADYIFLSGSTRRTEPRNRQNENGALVYSGGIQGKHLSILDIRIKEPKKAIDDVSAPFNRLQEIDYRLNKLRAKDPSKRLEDLYANQPNVLDLIKKYQKEATELGISLSQFRNRSIFFSVPLSPSIPDDKEVAALIEEIADKATFPLKHKH
tara:strand:- start:18915 stop:20027 length:1113 start_codon:yes stop_codon:yes gene_type:complete